MTYSRAYIKTFMEQNCRFTSWPTTWDTTDEKQFEEAVNFVVKLVEGLDEHMQGQPGYCWIHHTIEVSGPEQEVYCICFECKHTYITEQELVDAYNNNAPQDSPQKTKGTDIYFCPFCLHDF